MESKPFTFGIWMQYPPAAAQTGEGISRLNSWILRPLTERPDVRVVLAVAKWSEKDIRKLLADHKIPMDRVEIISSRRRIPFLIQIQSWMKNRARRSRPVRSAWWHRRLGRFWRNPVFGGIARALITTDSYLVAAMIILLTILFLPLILVLALVAGIFWKLVKNRVVRAVYRVVSGSVERFRADVRSLKNERWYASVFTIWKAVEDHEFRRLARKVARRRDIQVWYTPHSFATHIMNVGRPIVVAVPDLVYVDFFNAFGNEWIKHVDHKIRSLARKADATISYGNDVRERHVIRHLGVARPNARVIRHAAVDVGRDMREEVARFGGNSRVAATTLIQNFVRTSYRPSHWSQRIPATYLRNFPFNEVPFLFMSCQVRPNKNYHNLFRAFDYLLRRRRRNLKLIVTGNFDHEIYGLRDFINTNSLDLDILAIPSMPNAVHAAFYHLAALTVVPTLFEGGFPFQFSESMSVGTPAVMSDIPVTREVMPPALWKNTLFDPTNPLAIADSIERALDNRAALFEEQSPFYQELQNRTWDRVADEYLGVFREVSAAAATH